MSSSDEVIKLSLSEASFELADDFKRHAGFKCSVRAINGAIDFVGSVLLDQDDRVLPYARDDQGKEITLDLKSMFAELNMLSLRPWLGTNETHEVAAININQFKANTLDRLKEFLDEPLASRDDMCLKTLSIMPKLYDLCVAKNNRKFLTYYSVHRGGSSKHYYELDKGNSGLKLYA